MTRRYRTLSPHLALILGALVIASLLGGCSSARFIATGNTYPPRPEDCQIEVFSSRIPDREYVELGILEGEGSLGADTLARVLPKMKQKACEAGGDAIILGSSGKSMNVSGDDNWISSDEKLNVTATVIRWVE